MSDHAAPGQDRDRRRRDGDPIRVVHEQSGWRVVWWPSGVPGDGTRKRPRFPTHEAALARAEELREQLARGAGALPHGSRTLKELSAAWLDELRTLQAPTGTINQHRSRLNTHINPEIGAVACEDLTFNHWKDAVRRVAQAGAAPSTIQGVSSTLMAMANWGRAEKWLPTTVHPFGDRELRRTQLKKEMAAANRLRMKNQDAAARAAAEAAKEAAEDGRTLAPHRRRKQPADAIDTTHIGLTTVPTWADIVELSEAMEQQLPARGAAIVKVAAGSGLRIGELAGLQAEDVHLDTMTIDVRRQLSRYRPWPATELPKGGKQRTTICWAFLRPELEQLMEESVDGWLVPPTADQRWWLEALGRASERAVTNCRWRWPGLQWARHHFASYSLHGHDVGGYARDLAAVSKWLGHSQASTTSDIYLQPADNAMAAAFDATAAPPVGPDRK